MSFGHESHESFGRPNGRDYGHEFGNETSFGDFFGKRSSSLEDALSGVSGLEDLVSSLREAAVAERDVAIAEEEESQLKELLRENFSLKAQLTAFAKKALKTTEELLKAVKEKDSKIAQLVQESRDLRTKLSQAEAAKMVAESNERFTKSQLNTARQARDEYMSTNIDLQADNNELVQREQRLLQLVGEFRTAVEASVKMTTDDVCGAIGRATNTNYRGKRFLKVAVPPAQPAATEPQAPAAPAVEPENAEAAKAENPLAGLGGLDGVPIEEV